MYMKHMKLVGEQTRREVKSNCCHNEMILFAFALAPHPFLVMLGAVVGESIVTTMCDFMLPQIAVLDWMGEGGVR